MSKRALLVGVDHYQCFDSLSCCVDDATQLETLLKANEDGSDNYLCTRLTAGHEGGYDKVTEASLRAALRELTNGATRDDDLLFYFSGHGLVIDGEGTLVTQEAQPDDAGYPMSELLRRVNRCGAGSVMIILDCCHSGEMGNTGDAQNLNQATLSEGVTILSASSPKEASQEGLLNSLFTELVMAALDGGAADVRGHVSAASIYAYVEQALGPLQQRPMYKSYARSLAPLRLCKPTTPDEVLRYLPELFRGPGVRIRLDRSWEYTEGNDPENVRKFDMLKSLRNGRLLDTEDGDDLYFLAMRAKTAWLNARGRLYWQMARKGVI